MAVAWAIGAWANDSWLGMNAGPPNAWRGESTPAPAVTTRDTGAGHGHPQPHFWWELSTISFLTRAAIRRRRADPAAPPPEVPAFVPDLPAPAAIGAPKTWEDEASAAVFAANAEVARLESERVRAADDARTEELSRRIDGIKKELARIQEEQDVLFIAKMKLD